MSTVVDFETHKAAHDATAELERVLAEFLHEAVSEIAVLHGGMPAEWIDSKAAAAVDLIQDMMTLTTKPARVPVPASLTSADRAAIEHAVAAWMRQHNEDCRTVFARHLVELLGP